MGTVPLRLSPGRAKGTVPLRCGPASVRGRDLSAAVGGQFRATMLEMSPGLTVSD